MSQSADIADAMIGVERAREEFEQATGTAPDDPRWAALADALTRLYWAAIETHFDTIEEALTFREDGLPGRFRDDDRAAPGAHDTEASDAR